MKHCLFLSLSIIIAISCKSKKQKAEAPAPPPAAVKEAAWGNKFFDYDEIDYYFMPTPDTVQVIKLSPVTETKKIDSLEEAIYSLDTPRDINDLSFIGKLELLGYKKGTIAKDKFPSIDNLFSEKKVDDPLFMKCIPEYRDILIFKKQAEIIGVAKICFWCEQHYIIGSKAYTENFGQNGDYEKLANLLGKKNAMR